MILSFCDARKTLSNAIKSDAIALFPGQGRQSVWRYSSAHWWIGLHRRPGEKMLRFCADNREAFVTDALIRWLPGVTLKHDIDISPRWRNDADVYTRCVWSRTIFQLFGILAFGLVDVNRLTPACEGLGTRTSRETSAMKTCDVSAQCFTSWSQILRLSQYIT